MERPPVGPGGRVARNNIGEKHMALFSIKWGVSEFNCHATDANDAWCQFCANNAEAGKHPNKHAREITEIETLPQKVASPVKKKAVPKKGK